MKYLIIFFLFPLIVQAETFDQWKKSYAKKASRHGIPVSFSLMMLADVKLDPTVIKKDRNQVISSKKTDYKVFIKGKDR